MGRRYVTVGSGPAAMKACEWIRSLDSDGDIMMVGREAEPYYSRPGLAYYLADEVPEDGLFPFDRRALARVGADFTLGIVSEVRPAEHEVLLENGERIGYDRLLLATGSRAIFPQVEGVDLKGVVKLDNLEDAREIIALSRRAKSAVVVGGGITALEIVEGLVSRKVKVHYLMRRDRYWSNVLAEPESRLVEDRLRRCGVEVHYFTELGRILGRDGQVVGIETIKGEVIPCQIVGLAIGVGPRKDLAEAAGLQCGRGVIVDEHLRSSDPDIFIGGDLAETRDPVSGRYTMEVLWSTAVEKGRVAGLNMATPAEAPLPYTFHKAVPLNVTRLAGYRVVIMGSVGSGEDADLKGIARGDSETWRRMGEATTVVSDSRDTHIRLVMDNETVTGAVVMGDQEASFPLQGLVAFRVPLGRTKDRLLEPGANLTGLLDQAWHQYRSGLGRSRV
jgi:NAD(P)H-nitrite reductase large subunit